MALSSGGVARGVFPGCGGALMCWRALIATAVVTCCTARTRSDAHRRGSGPVGSVGMAAEEWWRRDVELQARQTGDIQLAVREREWRGRHAMPQPGALRPFRGGDGWEAVEVL